MRWLGLAASLGVAALLAPALLARLQAAGVVRENYRGLVLPAASGMLIAVTAAIVVGPLAALEELAGEDTLAPEVGLALVFVLGVGVLGLVDDLLGGRRPAARVSIQTSVACATLRAASHGDFSTGMLKLRARWPGAFCAGRGRRSTAAYRSAPGCSRSPRTCQPLDLRPGRAEGVRRARCGVTIGSWTLRAPGTRPLHRPGPGAPALRPARAAMLATRARTCSGQSRDCADPRARATGEAIALGVLPFSLFTESFVPSARRSTGTL